MPSDFRVEELLPYEPSGAGEHCWVLVRKSGWTTEALARLLAQRAGVGRGAISFAGLKDRHAIATQWLSVHTPKESPALEPGPLADGVEILEAARSRRKLRRGALSGNQFLLRLRGVTAACRAVDQRLETVARWGVPNYFGAQRFGRDGRNLEQARAWLLHGEPVRGRTARGLLLSAVRSELFNRILRRRVAEGSWHGVERGERAMLDGCHSHFRVAEVDASLQRRAALGEVHPTGPLPGLGGDRPMGRIAELEAEVLAEEPALVAALERQGARHHRRALRVMPRRLGWWWPDTETLELAFSLPAGAYATTMINEVLLAREAADA